MTGPGQEVPSAVFHAHSLEVLVRQRHPPRSLDRIEDLHRSQAHGPALLGPLMRASALVSATGDFTRADVRPAAPGADKDLDPGVQLDQPRLMHRSTG